MARVLLDNVVKRYGSVLALDRLTLEVHEGEFITLLGPSGCGKTTTLRLIAGFVEPSDGRICLGDDDVTAVPPQDRAIGMVFQNYALFPHLTIEENIGFSLKQRSIPRGAIARRVSELLELVKLPDVAKRYPSEISGGQQQRVALARAVAYPPRVLLMDEPLGALDLKLRESMQTEIRRFQQELKITTVYVTHDQTEAMTMSDRIAVMNLGKLEQLGTPREIYRSPRTRFIADFIGKINLLPGRISGRDQNRLIVETAVGRHYATASKFGANATVTLGIRPEHVALVAPDVPPGMNRLEGRIVSQTYSGNLLYVVVSVNDGIEILMEAKPNCAMGDIGSSVTIGWNPEESIVLPG
jgi:spermidine/putrescine ABC transporter ATP-binding subunit